MKLIIYIFLISSSIWAQSHYIKINTSSGSITYSLLDIQKLTFNLDTSLVSVEDYKDLAHILNSFILLQNYPNPFNPITTIEFSIPYSSQVEINIYDVNGQLINRLMNEFLIEGIQTQDSNLNFKLYDALGKLITDFGNYNSEEIHLPVNLKEHKAGVYYLNIIGTKDSKTIKLMVK